MNLPNTRWIVFGTVAVVVVVASLVSVSDMPSIGPGSGVTSDKFWHAAAYFCLALVALYALDGKRETYIKVAAGVVALGAGVEVAQAFLPYRTASAADAAANVVGVAEALVVSLLAEM